QAAVAFTAAGLRGGAMMAHAAAQRLAGECERADTPALRESSEPVPFTGRQREIVQLASHGLTNREIAERLIVSVRTVEGHLYRASQKAGVTSRADLVAIWVGK
ncbi:helix-turn-helix domain-containing protein, partial [Rhodococcus koreensis]